MATETLNYKFIKDDPSEDYDVARVNANLDKIDAEIKAVDDKVEAVEQSIGNISIPVESVNGKTGDVNLTAEDVGAETPEGASAKANAAASAALGVANQYTDQEVGKVSTQMAELTGKIVPRGLISMWSGLISAIPTGWALCNGQNGTPDLRDRFVMGATTDATINKTGGENEVTLTLEQIPSHKHSSSTNSTGSHSHMFERSYNQSTSYYATGYTTPAGWSNDSGTKHTVNTESAGSHSHTVTIGNAGGGQAHENRPAYYTLAFIMKL